MKIKVTKARRSEAKNILLLIDELADFERLPPPDRKAKNRIVNDAFGKKPSFSILLSKIDGKTIGYAFYFFTYSSFLARKTLYLEDIYISQKFRGFGAGKSLFNALVNIARKNKCGRMEWCVLDWNENAVKFYEKLGSKELKEWKYYRLSL